MAFRAHCGRDVSRSLQLVGIVKGTMASGAIQREKKYASGGCALCGCHQVEVLSVIHGDRFGTCVSIQKYIHTMALHSR